jgi:hypothetical protein
LLFANATDVARPLIVAGVATSVALAGVTSEARATAPLYDPVVLNIGISCQWQQSCQRRQMKALRAADKYIARENPPLWRIHLCNKNARRSQARVDWAGFNACIRNRHLTPPAPQPRRAARRH